MAMALGTAAIKLSVFEIACSQPAVQICDLLESILFPLHRLAAAGRKEKLTSISVICSNVPFFFSIPLSQQFHLLYPVTGFASFETKGKLSPRVMQRELSLGVEFGQKLPLVLLSLLDNTFKLKKFRPMARARARLPQGFSEKVLHFLGSYSSYQVG